MRDSPRVFSLHPHAAKYGRVVWQPLKSVWFSANFLLSVLVAPWLISASALLVFVILTSVTLCLGHSLGMHRLMIHRAYQCPRWLEYSLVYLGVLVGMAGPFGMLRQHDLRDWAQRQHQCHSYLRHGESMFKDAWWQLHCDLKLTHPPTFNLEARLRRSRFYRFLERSWLWQQLPPAVLLYYLGGLPWLVWGMSVRVVVSVGGHWLIGYYAHNRGHKHWHVQGAAVQGHNIGWAGLISMGEAWHNNHHAFPGSAKLGLFKGEHDPGWWVLVSLKRLGLVRKLVLPQDLPFRSELRQQPSQSELGVVQARQC